ncbi:MAG TPA: T9SS type A sorting domain-containing protein [Spirochaetota bacterium]|nr:T9SS type A sorting domain-containing protein [Spirochaetota bacterium]
MAQFFNLNLPDYDFFRQLVPAGSSYDSGVYESQSYNDLPVNTSGIIYPNPVCLSQHSAVYFTNINAAAPVQAAVYNIAGCLIWEGKNSWTLRNNLEQPVSPGVYQAVISFPGQKTTTCKILVIK